MIILTEGKAAESEQSLTLTFSPEDGSLYEEGSSDILSASSSKPPPRTPQNPDNIRLHATGQPSESMIVCPPNFLRSQYPAYFITVNMNVFTPFSYITTVRRDSWDGEMVGDFEMAISGLRKASTICFREYECPIEEVLEVTTKMFRGGTTYLWKSKRETGLNTTDLYWEEASFSSTSALSCFLGKEKTVVNLLAKFMPSNLPRRPGRPISLTRMDVTPKGHDYLDEIVMSMLIVERMRTAPSALKDLPTSMLKELKF